MHNNTRVLKWGVRPFGYLFWGGANFLWPSSSGVGRLGWSPSAGLQGLEPGTSLHLAEGTADSTINCESLEWAE